jgi:hypothetical protein
MRLAIVIAALLATGASGGGCGGSDYDPCGGKACGDACQTCPPDATDCVETTVVKACDRDGQCIPSSPGICP